MKLTWLSEAGVAPKVCCTDHLWEHLWELAKARLDCGCVLDDVAGRMVIVSGLPCSFQAKVYAYIDIHTYKYRYGHTYIHTYVHM